MISGLNSVKAVEATGPSGAGTAYNLTLNGLGPDEAASRVARAIAKSGLALYALHPEQRDLETVFAEITAGAEAQEAAHV